MSNPFFEKPIINSPYEYPSKHWELDKDGQPTQKTIAVRRKAEFITPIPKARKQKKKDQGEILFGNDTGISTTKQKYEAIPIINRLRDEIDKWRKIPDKNNWGVTSETARLLDHWRNHKLILFVLSFAKLKLLKLLYG